MTIARIATLALVLVAAAPKPGSAQIQDPDGTPPKSVRLTGTVDVPLIDPGIPGASLPVISVMVNGRGPYRFGVETGAGFVAVSREFVAAAGLARAGGSDDLPEYAVDSITFGGASFRGLKVAALPRSPRGVDGVLGLPFFHDVTFTIDYPANRFRISRDTLPAPNGKDVLAVSRVGPFWGVPLALAGQRFTAVVDTRSMAGLSITPSAASALPFDGELRLVGRSAGAGLPGADVREGQLRGNAELGAYVLPNPAVSVRELPPGFPAGPLVGSLVLRNFVVSLDQRRGRLRLAHQGSTTIAMPGARAAAAGAAGAAATPNARSGVAAYAGTYGDRTLTVVDGKLYIQRPGGQALELSAAGPDAFTIVGIPQARIEFGRDASGKVVEIRVLNQQQQWERVRRDSAAPR